MPVCYRTSAAVVRDASFRTPICLDLRSSKPPNLAWSEPDPETVMIPRRIYRLAYDKGWGLTRSAQKLNRDSDFVKRFGKISESLVGSIMTNTIYI